MARTASMKIWNVELGLAVHIKAPNGRYIVIDLGSTNNTSPLQSLYRKDVGYMIITHPHLDHFSDIQNIDYARPQILSRCKDYSRSELLEGVRDCDKDKITQYCNFAESYNGPVPPYMDPTTEAPFDGLTIEVFRTSACDKSNKNNFSSIVVLKLGNAKVVVCGDNEKESFEILMKRTDFKEAVKDAWVLVVPHHGRESGYYEEFVDLVKPDITIISDKSGTDTSASQKYTNKSKGYKVNNKLTGEKEDRYCLTTRKDGNIEVIFAETDSLGYIGTLQINTHI